MSKVLKVVGTVAGIVALSIAIPGAGTAIGLSAASAASVSAIASAVAAVASVGSSLLAKPPKQTVSGSLSQVLIAGEAVSPYIIGETYSGGVLRYDKGWGGKVGDVQNPYRALVTVHSVAGPVQSLEGVYLDFEAQTISGTAATGYYADFLWRDYQLGARPESSALAAHWAGMPEWGSASKLSSKAALIWSLKFDKEGKRYSGGVPQLGAVWKGVKVYDPRLDSTFPGGSGAHRAATESTWEYSDNPALHALTYAIGRFHNGKKLFGIGIPIDGIDVASFVAHANVCDANGWVAGGIIYEPGDRWDNLKAILAAGSAEPVFSGARLSVRYDAPRVSIATITGDDLADGEVKVRAMQSWRDRLNSVIPKYRSSVHRWEYVAADAVTVSTYVTEDGEEKPQEIQWNLVQDKDQAAQLAAYRLVNGRELAVDMTLKASARFWQPGDMLTIDIPEAGLASQKAVLLRRTVDPATMTVQATFIGETAAKHAFALGQTGVAPPTPSLLSPQDRDETATVNEVRAPFVADTEPTASTAIIGDEWFDSANGFRHYVFDGTSWVASEAAPSTSAISLPITAQNETTAPIAFALDGGASKTIKARVRVTGLSSSGDQTIQIQWRAAGGSYASLGASVTDSGGAGDTVSVLSTQVLTNGGASETLYEVRAIASATGGAGTIDQASSFIAA